MLLGNTVFNFGVLTWTNFNKCRITEVGDRAIHPVYCLL